VLHLYCSSFTTGRGAVERRPNDPATFAVEGVDLGEDFAKYAPVTRLRQERRYGRLAASRIADHRPEVVLSSNTPLLAQRIIQQRVHGLGARFVFWQQDVFAVAATSFARGRVPVLGAAFGRFLGHLERTMLARSEHVVVISEDFLPVLRRWGIDPSSVTVIENWAPLDELTAPSRPTGWAAAHGLAGQTVLLYSGTLGLKHNPALLLELARAMGRRGDTRVVVISEGRGADWLRAATAEAPEPALVLLPFQPYDVLAEVLGSADVLLAILEPEAGAFSVPSKVLSYHCVGTPILAAIPGENLAARVIVGAGSGVVVEPTDEAAFVRAAVELLDDPAARRLMGSGARGYAEDTFDIVAIATRFEHILAGAGDRSAPATSPRT